MVKIDPSVLKVLLGLKRSYLNLNLRNIYCLTTFEKQFWVKMLFYEYINQGVSKFAVTSFNAVSYFYFYRQNLQL